MNDLISVITPMYNLQEYIEASIQSALSQSHLNLELILVDDGSSDRTVEICQGYARKDSRIRLLTSCHGGVSSARNIGLDAAAGDYLFFLDGDDVIHPLLLETLVKGMKATGAQIGGTGCASVSEKNWGNMKDAIAADLSASTAYLSHPDALDAFFHTVSPINLIGGVMMHRDLVGQTRFRKDLFIGEDYYFVYQNLIKGAGAVFLDRNWYYSRIHSSNSSWDHSYEGFRTRFDRRRLVWENEEALGRAEYAACQKRDGFDVFLRCVLKNSPHSEDARKMRKEIKRFRSQLFPALTLGSKLRYCLAVYTPSLYSGLVRLEQALRGLLRRK